MPSQNPEPAPVFPATGLRVGWVTLRTRGVGRKGPTLSRTHPPGGPLPYQEGWGRGDPWHYVRDPPWGTPLVSEWDRAMTHV